MNVVVFVVAVIIGLMLAETRVSRLHEQILSTVRRNRAAWRCLHGHGCAVSAAFVAMGVEGVWRASHATGLMAARPGSLPACCLFVASKALKYWAIRRSARDGRSASSFFPVAPLVTTGPYRIVAHPNYIAVIGELAGAAMMCGARDHRDVDLAGLMFGARFVEARAVRSRRAPRCACNEGRR